MFIDHGPSFNRKKEMEEVKWYKNKKFWISSVSLVTVILGAFGITVSPELQTQLVDLINLVLGMFS